MMGNSFGWIMWLFWGFFMVVGFAAGLVWVYYSIRFFQKATENLKLTEQALTTRNDDMRELLAKIDQLVDVLKVK